MEDVKNSVLVQMIIFRYYGYSNGDLKQYIFPEFRLSGIPKASILYL